MNKTKLENDNLFNWTFIGNSITMHVILDFNMKKGILTLCKKRFKTKTVFTNEKECQCIKCLKEIKKCKKAFGWEK